MIDHPVWQAIQDHIVKALPEYITIFGLFSLSIIVTQPRPDVIDKWLGAWTWDRAWHWSRKACQKLIDLASIFYKWLYDAIQAFLLSRHPNPPQNPQQQETHQ